MMNKIKQYIYSLLTLGPLGFFPAPGTCASLCSAVIVVCCGSYSLFIPFVVLATISSFFLIYSAQDSFKEVDPQEVVIDECVGYLLMFLILPIRLPVIVESFFLFRFFDITKCCGVHYFERLKSPFGIMLDDIYSAFLTVLVTKISLHYGFL